MKIIKCSGLKLTPQYTLQTLSNNEQTAEGCLRANLVGDNSVTGRHRQLPRLGTLASILFTSLTTLTTLTYFTTCRITPYRGGDTAVGSPARSAARCAGARGSPAALHSRLCGPARVLVVSGQASEKELYDRRCHVRLLHSL